MNFVAGRMRRAPRIMQRMGLEWLWRILEEPKLATRYARDAGYLLGATFREVCPGLLERLLPAAPSRLCETGSRGGRAVVTVENRLGAREVTQLENSGCVDVVLRNVRRLDAAGAGWVYMRYFRSAGAEPGVGCDGTSWGTLARWGIVSGHNPGAC